ncbi:MAG: hypothetical protein JXR12_05425 [Neptunomonas phycophila]|uniref:hypothetical protein n=1 Tax=Neptunomonas phycophila TaxID=1572645 RepID=UPI003B8BD67A
MKKNLHILVGALVAVASYSATAGSLMVGTVVPGSLGVAHDKAIFQVDASDGGIDNRDVCLQPSGEVEFVIDLSQPGGKAIFDEVKFARDQNRTIQVNGSGVCPNSVQENIDKVNVQ